MQLKRSGMRLILVLLIAGLGVASLAWGIWTLAAPNYQNGQYPRFGHAADFSWIAGQVEFHIEHWSSLPEAGCSIFKYEEGGAEVNIDGKAWRDYYNKYHVQEGDFFVVFGHPASSGEKLMCIRSTPGYIVDRVQASPKP